MTVCLFVGINKKNKKKLYMKSTFSDDWGHPLWICNILSTRKFIKQKKKDPMDDFCGPTVELFGIIKKINLR